MADGTGDRESMHWWADATPRDWRNLRRFALAVAAWAVAFVGGASLLRGGAVGTGAVAWLVAALPAVLGVMAVLAYARYLRETDEFQRMVHFRALGLGFGGGWLVAAGYRLFELVGAPRADRAVLVVVVAVCFTIGLLLTYRRYA
ncbi:MAG TPA: hypothetical protein VF188_13070 [Longimicrobiales bacterium]